MRKTANEDLPAFIRRQPAEDLAALLIELCDTVEPVCKRVERLQLAHRPDKLAAAFRKQLAAWKRSTRFLGWQEAREFAATIGVWLTQVEAELLPLDPPAALALFEEFIEADAVWFERMDDSGGELGDVIGDACRHWLDAAARCETPAAEWPQRLMRLYDADAYGARDTLLRHADRLLDQKALHELAGDWQARLEAAVEQPRAGPGPGYEVFRLSGALGILSELLHEPELHVRAVLCYSPQPNEMQKQRFAQAWLEVARPEQAMPWLKGDWGHLDRVRRMLLAEALRQLGRHGESAAIRQALFETSLSCDDLDHWLQELPEAERGPARQRAHEHALAHADAVAAATMLLKLEDPAAAEHRLVQAAETVDGRDYTRLLPVAEALRGEGCARGETVVLRALLADILGRASARAYGHAAKYLQRLREIAAAGETLAPLPEHADLEHQLQARHPRKALFWAEVARAEGKPPAGGGR
ncbi:hypothetical protein CKO44_05815 [Rubrivivax gelatinosus]|uniref:DUF6880 family protein n=1 Tax=Rubrivivax gelatinosus TaxID=28068 RepID=UPI001903CFD9|nr:DUF6880 family protein [Rubrivivax gelatinosus]MBK1612988.1 hypothetical protein [Rubrivivax gelatinosus]